MKIIYLHQYFKFPNENGGTRSFDLSISFVEHGHTVEIITSTSDEKYKGKSRWTTLESDKLVVHYVYLPYGNHLSYVQRSMVFLKFLWFATLKLMSLKGDIVLATSTPLTIGIPALFKKWKDGTPFIFEVRDVWPEAVIAIGAVNNKLVQKLLYALERFIYKNASTIVPLSTDMQKSIISRFPEFASKTTIVVENIAEINRFKSEKRGLDLKELLGFQPRFSVLYAGTFGKVNGLNFVIDLADKTLELDPSIVFILIGEGAEKQAVRNYAEDKNVLNKNVFILNSISKEELPDYYAAVSMGSSFVIPVKELWANSANKFFDTLAASRPILINHEGWQAEVIRLRKIGYVLPVNLDKKSVHDFVVYTKGKAPVEAQQSNALEVAKESYSLEVAVKKYVKIFNKIHADV